MSPDKLVRSRAGDPEPQVGRDQRSGEAPEIWRLTLVCPSSSGLSASDRRSFQTGTETMCTAGLTTFCWKQAEDLWCGPGLRVIQPGDPVWAPRAAGPPLDPKVTDKRRSKIHTELPVQTLCGP